MSELTKSEAIQRSLFFVGAGFSSSAGCKTSVEMFLDLKNRIFDEQDPTFGKTQKEALRFLIACLQYHAEWRTAEVANGFTFVPNIEELALLIRRIRNRESFLPYPITGNWADKLVTLESTYSNELEDSHQFPDESLFESLERIMRGLLKDQWLKNHSNLNYLDPLKDFLAETTEDEYRFDIFTLNNDTVIETYFSELGELPWRGFVNGRWQGIQGDPQNDRDGRINLYKLHGSIDWVRLEDMDTWEEDKISDNAKENIQERHNPYVIFGQATKTFSIEPFFSLINYFNSQINGPSKDYFFIVGYSFFDPYINNLFLNAVKGYKKLIIVNPYFGPRRIYAMQKDGEFKPTPDPSDFHRVVYPEGTNPSLLSDYLRDIQWNSFFSELPEFNYVAISAENIEYIPLTTNQFIKEFFGNGGKLLLEFLNLFEDEKEKRQSPFS